jgi:hypothetical protein
MQGSLGKQAFCTPFISSKPFLLPDHARPVQVPNPHLSWYTRSCISVRDPVDPLSNGLLDPDPYYFVKDSKDFRKKINYFVKFNYLLSVPTFLTAYIFLVATRMSRQDPDRAKSLIN